jgi:hypothetical protein
LSEGNGPQQTGEKCDEKPETRKKDNQSVSHPRSGPRVGYIQMDRQAPQFSPLLSPPQQPIEL